VLTSLGRKKSEIFHLDRDSKLGPAREACDVKSSGSKWHPAKFETKFSEGWIVEIALGIIFPPSSLVGYEHIKL
jgi:hypothetical protein